MPDPTIPALDRPIGAPIRRVRRSGSVADAQRMLWRAIRAADDLLGLPDASPSLVLRVLHGLTQATAVYVRLADSEDLSGRLAALERRLAPFFNPQSP